MRSRLFVALRTVVLATLLVVPLLSRGHHHAGDASAQQGSCAVCAVTHQTPGVSAVSFAASPLVELQIATVFGAACPPVQRTHSPIAGRAPPSSSPVAIS